MDSAIDDSVRSSSGQMKKEALMHLIAQEMVTSLFGSDDNELEDEAVLEELQRKLIERQKLRRARKRSKRKDAARRSTVRENKEKPENLADAYYSHMTGDIRVQVKDDDSFAGGDLDDLVDKEHRSDSTKKPDSLRSLSRSRSSGQRKQQLSRSSQEGSKTSVTGSTSAASGATPTASSRASTEKELSIDEIRQFVVANIPQAVREQIPAEALNQIFGHNATSTHSLTPVTPTKPESVSPIGEIVIGGSERHIDDDEVTTYSEVSGLTSTFPDGRRVEYRRESLSHKPSLEPVEQRGEDGSKSASVAEDEEEARPDSARISATSGRSRNSLMDTSDHPSVARFRQRRAVTPADGSRKKELKFSEVQVRYYERIATDNPAVQSGPAIGIGWRYKRAGAVSVDYWEQGKQAKRKTAELVLPRHVRERLLRDAGVAPKEVADMVRLSLKARNQRKQTVNNLPAAGFEEAVEKAKRRVSRILSFGRKKEIV